MRLTAISYLLMLHLQEVVEELEHIEDEGKEIDEVEVEGIEQSAEDIGEDRRTVDRLITQQLIMTECKQR